MPTTTRLMRSRAIHAAVLGVLLSTATAADPPPSPGRTLSSWRTRSEPMPLAVIGAAAVEVGDRIHLLGGLDRGFEATAAIQTRSAREGWWPIGDRLAKPRAEASALRLADGRVLLLGGFAGTPGAASWHDDGEVLVPEIAGSAIELPAFGESLEGHSATLLDDGSVLVVAGRSARRLDPDASPEEVWGPAVRLPESRRRHAAVRLGDGRVLLACGVDAAEDDTPALRIIEVPDDPKAAPLVHEGPVGFAADLPPRLRDVAAARNRDGVEVLLAGGFDPDVRRTIPGTWWVDVDRGDVRPGVPLPVERGAARIHLAETETGVAILGGEWRDATARGPVDFSLLATGGATGERRLRLAPMPVSATRRMRILTDGIELLGGYRYRSPEEAAATGLPAGVHFDTRRYRLNLASPAPGD